MDVRDVIRTLSEVVELNSPARDDEIDGVEARVGHPVPADLRAFCRLANGSVDATPLEQGWIRFWTLQEWQRVHELGLGDQYSTVEDAVVIADHSIESWWYASEMRPNHATCGAVYIVDGVHAPRVVAASFREFVHLVLRDDATIYAVGESTG